MIAFRQSLVWLFLAIGAAYNTQSPFFHVNNSTRTPPSSEYFTSVHRILHLLRGLVNILLTSNPNLHLVYILLTSIYKRVTNLQAVAHTRPLLFTPHLYAGGSGGYLPTTSPLRLYLLQDGGVLTTCCWILS